MKKEISIAFIFFALMALLGGMLFGCLGALQFIYPGFLAELGFERVRPLHVSFVVAWIFLSAAGGIYYYLPEHAGKRLYSDKLPKLHLWLFVLTGLLIAACYFMGKFGGREYWEFPPVLSIPIFITWALFGWNYFRTVANVRDWPVYLWMWATGIVFFFLTFAEAHLWLIPYFGKSIVRDLTVQWKAYGALVGSWNMLVYGTALFIMERIKGDRSVSRSRMAFLMYFLGFANLLFGWAHHIYIVPAAKWIRILSYAMSMTELLILARIIWNWKHSLDEAKKHFYLMPARFLSAADFWIGLNLALALAISVPAINIYTHGTHITVAHAMGSTIGINTMILLASCIFITLQVTGRNFSPADQRMLSSGFWLTGLALFIFWLSLILAGTRKGFLTVEGKAFSEIMEQIHPWLTVFAFSGLGVLVGLIMVTVPVFRAITRYYLHRQRKG
ncbi:MAG: cbb3-type cytochrome c oxidase subunit I [Bacteroidota bacterium]